MLQFDSGALPNDVKGSRHLCFVLKTQNNLPVLQGAINHLLLCLPNKGKGFILTLTKLI